MEWARILTYVTGTVDQELLARNEYLATENHILKDQLKGRLMLSDAERATLGEIGHRLVARFSPRSQRSAGHDPGLGWSPVNSLAHRLVKVRADRGSSARWRAGTFAWRARTGTGATTGSRAPWPISGM
jgi:hypothetical protein